MKAIVLAAGFATRLHPLTLERAKPLLEVGGRPVLSWIVDRLSALAEVDEILIVTNGRFHAQFVAWLESERPAKPVRLVDDGTQDNESRLGAIADLSLALVFVGDLEADFLVVAGDNLIDFDLAPYAARFARERKPLLLVREIAGELVPGRYNEVVLDGAGGVRSVREKPADPRSRLSAICLYFLPADVRADLGVYLRTEMVQDAPGHFIAWLAARRMLAAEPLKGGWHDIGDAATLEAARRAFEERGAAR